MTRSYIAGSPGKSSTIRDSTSIWSFLPPRMCASVVRSTRSFRARTSFVQPSALARRNTSLMRGQEVTVGGGMRRDCARYLGSIARGLGEVVRREHAESLSARTEAQFSRAGRARAFPLAPMRCSVRLDAMSGRGTERAASCAGRTCVSTSGLWGTCGCLGGCVCSPPTPVLVRHEREAVAPHDVGWAVRSQSPTPLHPCPPPPTIRPSRHSTHAATRRVIEHVSLELRRIQTPWVRARVLHLEKAP